MQARVAFVLVIVLALASAVASVWVRGVAPQDQSKYQGSTFTCLDGSATIALSRVNDDYCDCESDGSDEPGTSACKKAKFYCANKLYVSETIYSSRVNDGICDCCDGTDEWKSRVTCPNTCREQGEHTRKEKAQAIEDYKEGLKTRQEYVEEAKKRFEDDRQKIQEIKAEILAIGVEVEQKEAANEETTNKEMAARAVLEKYQVPETEVAAPPAFENEDKWDSAEEEGEEGQDKEHEVEGEGEQQAEQEAKPEGEGEQPQAEQKPELTEEDKEKIANARAVLAESNKKKEELSELRKKASDLEGEIREKEAFLGIDFGPDNAYLPLYNQPIKYKTVEYTYELTPFKSVKQEWTSLGDWKKWLDNGKKMKYDDGASCWGVTYKRNCEVTVVCGKENKILEVAEPNKCEYTMTLATPAACDPAYLVSLEKEYEALVNPQDEQHTFDAKDII